MGVLDNETMTFINQTYQHAEAFLFGRWTYELFACYWGAQERARAALGEHDRLLRRRRGGHRRAESQAGR